MCFNTVANFSAAWLARKTGRSLEVVEIARRILAEQEQQFIEEQKKLPTSKRKKPQYFAYHIAEKTFNVAAYNKPQQVIVGPSKQLQVMRWGLKPRNASPQLLEKYAKGNWFVNANGERIFTEKTYPYIHIIGKQRCLIPQTGFIEFHHFSSTNKQPYYIEFPDRPDFMMAGLYEVTPIPGKKGYPGGGLDLDNPDFENYWYTFVQVTSKATPEVAKIHNGGNNPNRMPLILREQDEQLWLDPATPIEIIQGLIKPYDEYPINAWPITKALNQINPLAKELLERVQTDQELNLDFDNR